LVSAAYDLCLIVRGWRAVLVTSLVAMLLQN